MSSGPPPNYYGFTPGPPPYSAVHQPGQGVPPTHFPSAPYPGAPSVQKPGAAPTHFSSAPYSGAPPVQQHGAPPTHFSSAPYSGAQHVQQPGAPPTYIHPPQHFPLSNSVSNYYPAGETHFTSSFVPQSFTQMSEGQRWVHWQKGNMLPAHAVEAGYDVDRTKIYVGRLQHKGDLIPAKVIPQKNVAYIPYNGQEIPFHNCEILCQEGYVNWVRNSNGRVPPGAIAVGRTVSGETLYAARVHHNGSLTVGKVHPSHGVCYIPFGGQEIPHQEYEVLTS